MTDSDQLVTDVTTNDPPEDSVFDLDPTDEPIVHFTSTDPVPPDPPEED